MEISNAIYILVVFMNIRFGTSSDVPVINLYLNSNKPGVNWSVDDQCRRVYPNGSFCHTYANDICSNLVCRSSNARSNCFNLKGYKAYDGTPCGQNGGKSCVNGQCVADSTIPVSNCVYGDDLVTNYDFDSTFKIPTPTMTCNDAFTYISSQKYDPIFFCKNQNISFGTTCCKTCGIYNSVTCVDKLYRCPALEQFCNTVGYISPQIRKYCPYTCGICNRTPIMCSNQTNLCKNNAICINRNITILYNVAFFCLCKPGYSGFFCDNVDPCLVNGGPCRHGGTCQRVGSHGYSCMCKSEYSGYNCTEVSSVSPIHELLLYFLFALFSLFLS